MEQLNDLTITGKKQQTTAMFGQKFYRITFDTIEDKIKYDNCYKKVGKGEGAEWVLKKGYTEEYLLELLKKTKGYTVEFLYELGKLK